MASMLIDHFNKGIVYNIMIINGYSPNWLAVCSDIMEILGRVAFPIFLFLIAEGFFHTRSKIKYFLYLVSFGIISEVPYDMFVSGRFVEWGEQNMFFTLALALLTIWAIDLLKDKFKKKFLWYISIAVITFASGYISALAGFDYTYYGIIIPVIFYLLYQRRLVASFLSYAVIIKELWSFTGFALINLYNGERGKINKWIGYVFYPAHLLIIGLIRIFILKA